MRTKRDGTFILFLLATGGENGEKDEKDKTHGRRPVELVSFFNRLCRKIIDSASVNNGSFPLLCVCVCVCFFFPFRFFAGPSCLIDFRPLYVFLWFVFSAPPWRNGLQKHGNAI